MKQFFLIWLFLFVMPWHSSARQLQELERIEKMPVDTVKVNRLNDLAVKVIGTDPMMAINIMNKAIQLSEKINYPLGKVIANTNRASMLLYEMKLDSAEMLLDKSYELVKNETSPPFINQQASILQKYGAIFQQRQLYDTAIKKYLEAADLFKQAGHQELAIVGFYNISVMYGYLDQPEKSLLYAREVNRIAEKIKDPEFLLRSYIALGDAFIGTNQYDSVFFYAQKGLMNPAVGGNNFMSGKFEQLKGIYFLKGSTNYNSALSSFNISLRFFDKINLPFEKAMIYQNMAHAFLQKKDYPNVIEYGNKALALTRSFKMYEIESETLFDMAQAAEYNQQTDSAYNYLKRFIVLKDTLSQLNNRKLVNELDARYQSQKKEALLLSQQNTIYKKNVLNYILLGSGAVLILLSALGYYNYRQKQKLQQQRISELETQQQLMATAAVLKGEEQERTRLAKDLHDGLGGMLSGIKYSFNNMKGNLVMTEENRQAFERSMDMLDSSIQEMRRVAHSMMPEVLLKFGLDTALKDFCNDINRMGVIKVSYQSIGLKDVVVAQTSSIAIYRIVQELIHNTLKHAAATSAIVQVSHQNGHFSLTVEDDGKGFDKSMLTSSPGIGWSNIKSRVDFLKGKMDVRSDENKGTSVHVEIELV